MMNRFSFLFLSSALVFAFSGYAGTSTSSESRAGSTASRHINQGGTTELVSFFDNFDSYTAGTRLVSQNNVDWDTWSGGGGTSEDPFVSSTYSNSPSNSVVIAQNNDAIRRHGDVTSGVWSISFDMYIPSGKAGYFNTMSSFDTGFYWVMEAYFNSDGTGDLLTGDPDESFSWTADTWQTVEVLVDLDADLGEFIFDGVSIHSWPWTSGTSGGTGALQLAVTDFFGATANDEMYVDNYEVNEVLNSLACGDLFFFGAKCNSAGKAQGMIKIAGDFGGQEVAFDLDGEIIRVTLLSNGTNSIARMEKPMAGFGSHTVTLVDPAGCFDPVSFNCQVDAPVDPQWAAIEAEYEAMRAAQFGDRPTSMGVVSDRQVALPSFPETTVLYDQTGAAVIGSGYTSQDFEAAFDAFDNQGADDFVVPAGETWNVNQVTAIGVYYNGFGLMPTARVQIYSDAAGFPGALVSTEDVTPTDDGFGVITCDIAEVSLSEGTYWVSVQAVMDFGVGGQWGWTPNNAAANSGAAWQNPGNGFATGCTTWGRITACIGALEPDLAFIICGTTGGGGGIPCGDIFFFNAKCNSNGAAQAMVKITGDYGGETVTFSLDDTPVVVTLLSNGTNSIGKMQVPMAGFGAHTVELVDPAGCFNPVNFNCQVDALPDPEWDAIWNEYEALAQAQQPVETKIIGNYPNPFNPSTTIRYALGVDSPVSVKVFNMLGQEVATLVDGFQKAGEQSVVWHGVNNFGQAVASGLYIYRIQAGNTVMTQKMLFTK